MNFYLHLNHALTALKRAPLLLIVGNLLVSALTVLSFGLLIGPLYGAYQEMMIRLQRDDRRPEPADLLRGFSRFGLFFPLFFLALVLLAGFALYVLPGLILATFWLYALPLMTDRGLTLVPALNASAEVVKEKGFFKHLFLLLLITIVPSLLFNILGNLVPAFRPLLMLFMLIFLPPLQQGFLASLYLANFPPVTDLPDGATDVRLNGASKSGEFSNLDMVTDHGVCPKRSSNHGMCPKGISFARQTSCQAQLY